MDPRTDGQTDGRTDKASYRDAWTHLKIPSYHCLSIFHQFLIMKVLREVQLLIA